jgi:hypothetical protein
MTNVNDNVRISDNIGVVASSSSKQLSSIRTLSLPFFILNILLFQQLFFVETSNHYHYSMFILKMGINHRLAQYDPQKKNRVNISFFKEN